MFGGGRWMRTARGAAPTAAMAGLPSQPHAWTLAGPSASAWGQGWKRPPPVPQERVYTCVYIRIETERERETHVPVCRQTEREGRGGLCAYTYTHLRTHTDIYVYTRIHTYVCVCVCIYTAKPSLFFSCPLCSGTQR